MVTTRNDPVTRLGVAFVRWLGRQVCSVRGHRYHPIESLPYRPDDEEFDSTFSDEDYQEEIERQHKLERRWFSCLPYLRWI